MSAATIWAAGTNTGLVRSLNEDSAYAGRWLHAVADGMGGHPAGEVASATVIDALAKYDVQPPTGQLAEILGSAVRNANAEILRRTQANPDLRGMGTTLTAVLWSGRTFALAHIGDSRAYRMRTGNLHQLTEDHTLHNLVANSSEYLSSVISRYLDGRPDRSPDLALCEARQGDRYLLCSDGLSNVVSEARIREVLKSTDDPESIVERLILLAINLGGPDNVTVILVDVTSRPHGTELTPLILGSAISGAAAGGGGRAWGQAQ